MVHQARRVPAAAAVAAVLAALAAAVAAQQAQGTQQPPPPQQTPPVFRAATHFVQVDAFPTRDGRIIEGLTAKDFQVFEDGKLQTIENVEFVRIEPGSPEAMRRDPNTQEEGNRLAADPRNRVFVLYLDHYHGSLAGSYGVREPIVAMLNRMLAPNDLFGVATPLMKPRDLILGRQTLTIEDQLARHWSWGLPSGTFQLEDSEEGLVRCYGHKVAMGIVDRVREEKTLMSLSLFVRHLGALREARKALLVFSRGWVLYEPDQGTMNSILGPENFGKTTMGIGPGGKLSTTPPNAPGMADWSWCAGELSRAYTLDNRRRFQALIDEANRANVAFYPVNLDGVSSGGRGEALRTLAENTDGVVTMTNDFGAGLRRVADDVSAYYLLGYYSTNTKLDGSYRRIDVKVAQPGSRVKARRGYLGPAPPREIAATAPKPTTPPGIVDALDVLSRLRPSAELFSYGVVDDTHLRVVVELPAERAFSPDWQAGGDVQVTVGSAPPVSGRIEAATRGVLLTLPKPPGDGPYRVSVVARGGEAVVTDRVDITPVARTIVGDPIIFRATPAASSPLRPVADYQFRRTERVHVEWSVLAPLDRRTVRLLGRDGGPLPVPVTVTERDRDGRPVIAATANLAPLAAGDYVLELVAAAGGEEVTRHIGIRVIR